ncbi:egg cell-secreted protein 1.1-like [Eucalyptus grandis]|uniref:egg cell-secreted protein 1.1-like n=1 Tax=Eucalyptus grandis TaxID=71139 RepID=UPI00192E9DA9|nr:egg cell-secreted protein 1.1-like [Eucalyptus grandis]
MPPIAKLFIFLLILASSYSAITTEAGRAISDHNPASLAARLKVAENGSDSSHCWESMFQLQACTSEVILFFLNGETYLGPGCCQAIRTIEHQCWPNLLSSLGYTTEEGDILEGYCDAAETLDPPPAPVVPNKGVPNIGG